jgi:hypothetical protein
MRKRYNGWANYATWRVNLELLDGMQWTDFFGKKETVYDASLFLKEYVEDIITQTSNQGIARDYALAFLNDVDYYEIAQLLYADYSPEEFESPNFCDDLAVTKWKESRA